MRSSHAHPRRLSVVLALSAVASLAAAGCNLNGAAATRTPPATPASPSPSVATATATSSVAGATATPAPSGGRGCTRIGVFLPNTTDARWAVDGPALTSSIQSKLPGSTVDEQNANGDAVTQAQQAQAGLAAGDCILVIAPVDPAQAAQIVTAASARGVPVIAYDRLVQSKDTAYFVGFDQQQVGALIGQYVVDHYQDYVRSGNRNVAVLNGDQRDPAAILVRQGYLSRLQPLFDNTALRKVYDQFTPGGSVDTAELEAQGILTASSNNVEVFVTTSDALATGAIRALTALRLNGKALVTGSGATVAGLHAILVGDQAMTVLMDPRLEADGTAQLVAALSSGSGAATLAKGTTATTAGDGQIPSILETPVAVDKTDMKSAVIDAGLAAAAAICAGVPAGTAGICP